MSIRLTNVTVELYAGEPNQFFEEPGGPVFRELDRRAIIGQFTAMRTVRVRTGKLLSSIRKQQGYSRNKPFVEVVAGGRTVRYARFENDGTPAHIIRAKPQRLKRGGSLRFIVGGTVVFRKQVRHPGTRGSHYMDRALESMRG